jgi:hypothetical protein
MKRGLTCYNPSSQLHRQAVWVYVFRVFVSYIPNKS